MGDDEQERGRRQKIGATQGRHRLADRWMGRTAKRARTVKHRQLRNDCVVVINDIERGMMLLGVFNELDCCEGKIAPNGRSSDLTKSA